MTEATDIATTYPQASAIVLDVVWNHIASLPARAVDAVRAGATVWFMTGHEGTTPDEERWLVIDGRRWRRTDPSLPEDLVAALTSHLGRGRSAVRTATRSGDDEAVAEARSRVDIAKHGLGERGPYWWEEPEPLRLERARDAVRRLDAAIPHPCEA